MGISTDFLGDFDNMPLCTCYDLCAFNIEIASSDS